MKVPKWKPYEGELEIQQMQVIQSDLDDMAEQHTRAMKAYGTRSEQAKRAFRLYKRMAYRKELLDCERSQMVEGEWEITKMQAVTIEDLLQKREERRQATDKYGLDEEGSDE